MSTEVTTRERLRAVPRELAVIVGLFVVYRSVRLVTRDDAAEAFANADRVVAIEEALGIAFERGVQRVVLSSEWAVELLNRYYVSAHFPVTVAFLVWAFVRSPGAYRAIRSWFVVVTFTALVVHVAYPLAPPRMLPGFVDTLERFGPRIYSGDPSESIANQFAAMPSLHFGWSVMVAAGWIAIRRTRASAIALVHPAVTLLAIVATANHYWLDALVALVIVAAGGALIVAAHGRRARRAVTPPATRSAEPPPAPIEVVVVPLGARTTCTRTVAHAAEVARRDDGDASPMVGDGHRAPACRRVATGCRDRRARRGG